MMYLLGGFTMLRIMVSTSLEARFNFHANRKSGDSIAALGWTCTGSFGPDQ